MRHDQFRVGVAPEAGVQPEAKTEAAEAQTSNLDVFAAGRSAMSGVHEVTSYLELTSDV